MLACSALAMLREQAAEVADGKRTSSSTLLSQERLICKAAGLSHLLSNEVLVNMVSSAGMTKKIKCVYLRRSDSLAFYLTLCFSCFQPCQTVYQVLHDAVTRLIQYGVLIVAEVTVS